MTVSGFGVGVGGERLEEGEVCVEGGRLARGVRARLHVGSERAQSGDEPFVLLADPRPAWVCHVVRGDVGADARPAGGERPQRRRVRHPRLRRPAVPPVQPVHVGHVRPADGGRVRHEVIHQLVQHHAPLAEPDQRRPPGRRRRPHPPPPPVQQRRQVAPRALAGGVARHAEPVARHEVRVDGVRAAVHRRRPDDPDAARRSERVAKPARRPLHAPAGVRPVVGVRPHALHGVLRRNEDSERVPHVCLQVTTR